MISIPRMIAPVALAAGLVAAATAAQAAPGIAVGTTNVRSGPGTGYAIVDQLHKGEYVVVISCGVSWCKVHRVGPDGYVSRTRIFNPYYGSHWRYQFPPSTPSVGRTTR